MNFLWVVAALAFAFIALREITAASSEATLPEPVRNASAAESISTRVRLLLSAPASTVKIQTLDDQELWVSRPAADDFRISGTFELPLETRALLVQVEWAGEGGHRFAKLTLEPQGLETQERFFESRKDVDEVWELTPLRR